MTYKEYVEFFNKYFQNILEFTRLFVNCKGDMNFEILFRMNKKVHMISHLYDYSSRATILAN